MTEKNREQEAASSNYPWAHLATLFIQKSRKDNTYMIKYLLCFQKNTEISAFEISFSSRVAFVLLCLQHELISYLSYM